MPILAAETLEKTSEFLQDVGLYPTIVAASVGVFVLAYLIRAVENYVRHLHRKSYLPYSNPRFILTAAGCALVFDGFLVVSVFQERLPLHAGTVTTSAGLLCLIAGGILSIVPHIRQMRRVGRHPTGGATRPADYADRVDGDGPPKSDH